MKKNFSTKTIALLSLMCVSILPMQHAFGQSNDGSNEPKSLQDVPKNSIVLGAGGVNFIYMAVKSLDKVNLTDTPFFANMTQSSVKQLWYLKYERQLAPRHTLGLNIAQAGFTVGGLVRDSFFFNDMGQILQLNASFEYTTTSFNLRYNYLFNPNSAVKVYWGAGIGLRTNSVKIEANNPKFSSALNLPGINIASIPTMGFESTLGFRGNITPQLGLYGEIGIAKSVFQGGLSYSF